MFQWHKDRKERVLSLDDIKQYCKIATSLSKTIEFQKKIDEIYSETERDIIKLENVSSVFSLEDYS